MEGNILLNRILNEIVEVKENQNKMVLQISDLNLGQNNLNEKIDNVRKELKQELQEVRIEFKKDIREDIQELEKEIEKGFQDLSNGLEQDIRDMSEKLKYYSEESKEAISDMWQELNSLRETVEFTKDTCMTIMRVCQEEFGIAKNRFILLKLMNKENREKYQNHEYRISNIKRY